MKRRGLLKAGVAAAASYSRILGAHDRIHVGIIGAGWRGATLWREFLEQPDTEPAAVCDVYGPHLERAFAASGNRATPYRDFRRLLEHKPLDAVIVATPDHWHAIPAIRACAAGLDVYVEKPLSHTVEEGRQMVEAARKYNRIVQTGTQQRSGRHYQEVVEIIRSGELGEVHHVEAGIERNSMPGFPPRLESTSPVNLDFNMWLGPAPEVPYDPFRVLYNFRWFWDYSGGQTTNFGPHDLDVARWALGLKSPLYVTGVGGRYALTDPGETPDVQDVSYEFPDTVITWSIRELNGARKMFLEFQGTEATLSVSRRGYRMIGQTWQNEEQKGQDREWLDATTLARLTSLHVRNFLDCVKSRRRPNADVEDGHLTATMCHLGNIATRLRRPLHWDAEREQIVGDPAANQWLSKSYRPPWTLNASGLRHGLVPSRSRSRY